MKLIENKVSAAKAVINDIRKSICYAPNLKDAAGKAVLTGQPESDALLSGATRLSAESHIYRLADGRLVLAEPRHSVCVTETPDPDQWAKLTAAAAEIESLQHAKIKTADVIETALSASSASGKPSTLRYGSSVAIRCDAASGTVLFAWHSPAGYDDDPMSQTGGILPPSEDSRYNETSVATSDRPAIERMAKSLNISLVRESIAD